ncbi:hypothetical protein VIGAN_06067400 [Vigna angularis var. angularis]|uniref:Uncharacterized protein n=1 Tax=Vigna angularis var. angularis TaxID=157739 RepID=A0A0S3S9W0_PHAAN|nr:hypothetical protein VIGAN_06067400 [Vigna angularis var. angularis]
MENQIHLVRDGDSRTWRMSWKQGEVMHHSSSKDVVPRLKAALGLLCHGDWMQLAGWTLVSIGETVRCHGWRGSSSYPNSGDLF